MLIMFQPSNNVYLNIFCLIFIYELVPPHSIYFLLSVEKYSIQNYIKSRTSIHTTKTSKVTAIIV